MDVFQIADIIKEFFISVKDWLVSLNWPEIISVLRTICTAISAILFVGIVGVIIETGLFSRLRKNIRLLAVPTPFPRKLGKKWDKIESGLRGGQEANLKVAVIEADKFFDNILKRIGYLGKDMGERLKKINASQMANINEIWQAHKIRNNIVHDVDYKLTEAEAEKAVSAYKKALEELEIL